LSVFEDLRNCRRYRPSSRTNESNARSPADVGFFPKDGSFFLLGEVFLIGDAFLDVELLEQAGSASVSVSTPVSCKKLATLFKTSLVNDFLRGVFGSTSLESIFNLQSDFSETFPVVHELFVLVRVAAE
jgi:hypothetical protein